MFTSQTVILAPHAPSERTGRLSLPQHLLRRSAALCRSQDARNVGSLFAPVIINPLLSSANKLITHKFILHRQPIRIGRGIIFEEHDAQPFFERGTFDGAALLTSLCHRLFVGGTLRVHRIGRGLLTSLLVFPPLTLGTSGGRFRVTTRRTVRASRRLMRGTFFIANVPTHRLTSSSFRS
jgi:hypothetical protein